MFQTLAPSSSISLQQSSSLALARNGILRSRRKKESSPLILITVFHTWREKRKKNRTDFSQVNSSLSPFAITVIPSPFFGRMNRNRQLTSLSNCTPIWDSHYTHYNGWRGDIYHYAHTRGSRKAGQCFHRVACARENSAQEPRDHWWWCNEKILENRLTDKSIWI